MRINLAVPYAEKDEAKTLGARWDPAKKCWYVQDPKDLGAFARWLPEAGAAAAPVSRPAKVPRTGPSQPPAHCGCDVLPWEACIHSPRPA